MSLAGRNERAEHERQILRLLARGERKIAAAKGHDLDEVLAGAIACWRMRNGRTSFVTIQPPSGSSSEPKRGCAGWRDFLLPVASFPNSLSFRIASSS